MSMSQQFRAEPDRKDEDFLMHWQCIRSYRLLLEQTRVALVGEMEENDSFREAVRLTCASRLIGRVDLPDTGNEMLGRIQDELEAPGGLAAACLRRLRESPRRHVPDLVENTKASEVMEALGTPRSGFDDGFISASIDHLFRMPDP